MAKEMKRREQTKEEEILNTVSHGAGAVLALAGFGALFCRAVQSGSGAAVFSIAVYGLSLIFLYMNSAIYHGTKNPERKRTLRVFDHCSIFLLILGTYIPLSLLAIGGTTGTLLCLANTVLAGIGITLNIIDLRRFSKISLVLYVLMGWLAIAAIRPLLAALPPEGFGLLLAGGVAYTIGILFYRSRGKYMHFVWHLFVLAGSILHFICVARYCL